ncbi:MAG TPA: PKD domain-containing protein, partial [Longimicrobiaceae bacterium]|nr:PKD domain-containing protein [Longimicrobiaceae bacterium]
TDQENAATFLLSNIIPQAGENNQGPWLGLENHLNDLARDEGKEIYVVAGGEYSASPGTLKNEGKVAIPDYTWKVAVIMNGGEGLGDVQSSTDIQVIAARFPNLTTAGGPASAVGIRNVPWQTFEVTVDEIEALVGYDLLSALPNVVEAIVESNDQPPVASTDGPYTGIEGSSVTLDASGSSDPDGDALTFAWDFGDGGTGTGATPTHVYADNGNYLVTVTATDPYGATSVATTTVTVFNVAPTAGPISGATLLPGETYAASGSISDPGADTFTGTVDYGDGGGAQPLAVSGNTFSLSHVYAAAGTFAVTVTVMDDEGAPATTSATVTVLSAAQAIVSLQGDAAAYSGRPGIGSSLDVLLRNALREVERGRDDLAVQHLETFIAHVQNDVASGNLTAAEGNALIAAAQRIVDSLE